MTNLADATIEQAVTTYLNTLTPEQLAQSNAYFEGGYWLILWNLVYGLVLAWILLRSGLSVNMRKRANRWSRFSFLRTWIYFIQHILFVGLAALPLTIYVEYFREHKYGLSNLSLSDWTVEQLKGLGVSLVLGGLFVGVIYWVIAKFKTTWWVWGSLATTLLMVFSIMIAPVFIAPIFNKYTALPSGEVRDTILSMARGNGVPADEVYQFDASKQSKRISANVSGIFGTMRVSLNDNLLNRTSLPEIRAVMGHELGHYVLHHVNKMVIEFSLLLMLGFYCVYRASTWVFRVYGPRWGIVGAADVAGLPVLMALLSVFMTVATPVFNTITRTAEAEADVFGLNLAREPDAFAKVAVKLSEYRKMSPSYWEEVFFFDHPSGESRIRMAMTWKQENLNVVQPKNSTL